MCTIIHCGIEVFQQSCVCPNNTLSKDYSLFSLESQFVLLFCPYIHDSIYPSSVMSAFSLHVSCCSQSVLMAHQVVMAFQLLQHSFLYVPRGDLFFSSVCCKISPWVDQKLWGALKARYVVLILEQSCLLFSVWCHFGFGLPSGGTVVRSQSLKVCLGFCMQEKKRDLCYTRKLCEREKEKEKEEGFVYTALVSCSTEEWLSMARGGEKDGDLVTTSPTDMIDFFNNLWLLF